LLVEEGYILIPLLKPYDMSFYPPPTLIPCKEYAPSFLKLSKPKLDPQILHVYGCWIYTTCPNPRGISKLIIAPLLSDSIL